MPYCLLLCSQGSNRQFSVRNEIIFKGGYIKYMELKIVDCLSSYYFIFCLQIGEAKAPPPPPGPRAPSFVRAIFLGTCKQGSLSNTTCSCILERISLYSVALLISPSFRADIFCSHQNILIKSNIFLRQSLNIDLVIAKRKQRRIIFGTEMKSAYDGPPL